jgi:glycyl-tRNA synthetase beta chain
LMGRYYAEAAGEDATVALAAQDHYSPLGPSDDVPTAPVSVAVALADKLDTLAGFWAIDEKPTGSKDPYALRRAALGVIRLVLSANTELPLYDNLRDWIFSIQQTNRSLALLRSANRIEEAKSELRRCEALPTAYPQKEILVDTADSSVTALAKSHAELEALSKDGGRNAKIAETAATDLLTFFHDRLKQHLKSENIRHDVIDACLTGERTDDLANVTARARALNAFLGTDDGENLIQGYKRAKNILDQAEAKDGVEYSYGGDPKLAETDAERALFAALTPAKPAIEAALKAEDYPAAMAALAALRTPIDAFFEAVQVNADSEIVRRNRLNLLSEIVRLCAQIADLGRIGS